MSALRAEVPIDRLPGTTTLFRDFVARADAPVHRRLRGFRAQDEAWRHVLGTARGVDARLVERMAAENQALGASRETIERVRGLADGRTRAVITGQQPGVAGGPLLSLYKAASAVALAREIEVRWKTPCVAVFWLGSDDDDFAEIRDLFLVSDTLSVVGVSLDGTAHAPGRRVGDVAGTAVARSWDAVSPFLPKGDSAARIDAIVRGGDDLGRIAARVLMELAHGSIAVIDGREPLLRDSARTTILEFFDREDAIRGLVVAGGDALLADGYHAQLDSSSDSGLFLVREGTRQRIPAEARATARAAFAHDVGAASPGVVARNLIQDSVFAPVAVVLGPAEIAYRAQLARVYDIMGVDTPVVFPRLGATFVPPAVAEAVERSGTDATLLATDPSEWVVRVMRSLESPRAAEAARAFEGAFRADAARFIESASGRLDPRAREKLERRVADLANRVASVAQGAVEQDALAGASQWPWLARASDLFARDGAPQERFLSALVPQTFHDHDAWGLVLEVASDHVRDALDGTVLHRVYSR
ncbi:MAG TPA: bacillithiol biosynthesis BshC [Candidatus Krumholzibacteria bacterium]|nr:bacillithiol biosynthesis BshC [Candidatus Krumholzibacteria bacterium]